MDEWAEIRNYVNEELERIREDIKWPTDLVESAFHLIKGGGKRIRPFLLMVTSKMFGVPYNVSLPAAVSIELLHNFTLIHDDITDRDRVRRGLPTTHVIYGEPIALVAGDFLFSHLYYYLINTYTSLGKPPSLIIKIVSSLSEATDNICKGQVMDLLPHKYISSEENYMKMVYLKTASLIETAVYIGGLLGGVSPETLSKLRKYGKNIGVAFQIADDILGVFGESSRTGKPVGNDIRMGKKTLLVLYALSKMNEKQKQLFDRVFGNRSANDKDIEIVINLLREIGAKGYADKHMKNMVYEAKKALVGLPENIYRKYLENISDYIITREL